MRWNRFKVFLAHLFPRTHWGVYTTDSSVGTGRPVRRFIIWRQWGNSVKHFEQFDLAGWDMNANPVGRAT